jgi:hypothetical protein
MPSYLDIAFEIQEKNGEIKEAEQKICELERVTKEKDIQKINELEQEKDRLIKEKYKLKQSRKENIRKEILDKESEIKELEKLTKEKDTPEIGKLIKERDSLEQERKEIKKEKNKQERERLNKKIEKIYPRRSKLEDERDILRQEIKEQVRLEKSREDQLKKVQQEEKAKEEQLVKAKQAEEAKESKLKKQQQVLTKQTETQQVVKQRQETLQQKLSQREIDAAERKIRIDNVLKVQLSRGAKSIQDRTTNARLKRESKEPKGTTRGPLRATSDALKSTPLRVTEPKIELKDTQELAEKIKQAQEIEATQEKEKIIENFLTETDEEIREQKAQLENEIRRNEILVEKLERERIESIEARNKEIERRNQELERLKKAEAEGKLEIQEYEFENKKYRIFKQYTDGECAIASAGTAAGILNGVNFTVEDLRRKAAIAQPTEEEENGAEVDVTKHRIGIYENNMPKFLEELGLNHSPLNKNGVDRASARQSLYKRIKEQADGENKIMMLELGVKSDYGDHISLAIGPSKDDPNKIVIIDSGKHNPIFSIETDPEDDYASKLTGRFIELDRDQYQSADSTYITETVLPKPPSNRPRPSYAQPNSSGLFPPINSSIGSITPRSLETSTPTSENISRTTTIDALYDLLKGADSVN